MTSFEFYCITTFFWFDNRIGGSSMNDLKKLNKAIDTIQQDKKTTTFCINIPTSLRDKIVKYSKTKKVSASMMIKTVFSELVENQS